MRALILVLLVVILPSAVMADGLLCANRKGVITARKKCLKGESRASIPSIKRSSSLNTLQVKGIDFSSCQLRESLFNNDSSVPTSESILAEAQCNDGEILVQHEMTLATLSYTQAFFQEESFLLDQVSGTKIGVRVRATRFNNDGDGSFQLRIATYCCPNS